MADQHLSSSDRLVSSEESILGTQMNNNDLANVSASAVALHLLSLTYDVQLHIWSFLRTNGLAALMRTCRQVHELALPTLCARTRDVTLSKPSHIASFHDFIRVPHLLSPAIPRTSLVRELHIDVSSNALTHANLDRSAETRAVEVLPAILRSCPRLKRLSVLEYYFQPSPQPSPQLSFQLVLDAISTLHSLEELMIDFGKVKYGYGELLRTIAQLHLRKLTITGISNTIRSSMTLVSSLGQLAPILAELELPDYAHRCAAARVVFPGVRKLGIYVWVSSPYASSLARSFPNLTHLVLRSRWSNARGDIREIGIFDQARVEHRRQWQENRSLWPSLMYVQAEDPVLIYILAFPRYIRHVSAWWATQTPSYIFPTIVADMRPDTFELCLTQQNYGHYDASLSLNLSDPSSDSLSCTSDSRGSIPCLRNLIANFQDFDSVIYPGGATDEAVNLLASALPELPLTHLLLRFTVGPATQRKLMPARPYPDDEAESMLYHADKWAGIMAHASRTLQWVGVHVYGAALRSWTISRLVEAQLPGSSDGVEIHEEFEAHGWATITSQEMYTHGPRG